MVDLCGGSGCVAICIAKIRPDAKIISIELSDAAFWYLNQNIDIHGARNVTAVKGDVLQGSNSFITKPIDLIVSNPPYIPSKSIRTLQREVGFEPRMALDGGADGLKFYHAIADLWVPLLNRNGRVAVEIDVYKRQGLYEALQSAAGADIKLKYPGGTESSRSAFLISKFESDSSLQAVACYRPSGEAAVTHLNFLKRQNGRWKSVYDLSGAGNDIELAEVVDFDADGISELVTMWSLPNSSDKRLAVLRVGESGFTPIIEQDVRNIYLMDFDGDNSEELLQICLLYTSRCV